MKPNQFLLIVMFVVSFGHNSSVLALNSNEKKQNEVYCKNFQSGSFVNQCSSGHTSKFKRLDGVQVQEYGNFYLKEKMYGLLHVSIEIHYLKQMILKFVCMLVIVLVSKW